MVGLGPLPNEIYSCTN